MRKRALFLLVLWITVMALAVPAQAASVMEDGLRLTLTPEESTYELGQVITAKLTVENTNSTPMEGVSLQALIPRGYCAAGDVALGSRTLQPGEQAQIPLTYRPESAPVTGDWSIWIPIGVLAVCGALILLLKRRGVCLVLCFVLVLGMVPGARAAQAGKTLTVNTNVIVGGKPVRLEANVSYCPLKEQLDTDGDGLPTYLEELLGTNPERPDTDGDGVFDGTEVLRTGTDPLLWDTDGDGKEDGRNDTDADLLTDAQEQKLHTHPADRDSDDDGIFDGVEVNILHTDPNNPDTDGDGVSDGREQELGTDPKAAEAWFQVKETAEDGRAYVDVSLGGEQVSTLDIQAVDNPVLFPDSIPGYLGKAYDLTVEGSFATADISFRFNEQIMDRGAQPTVYYYNEAKQVLEPLPTRIENGVATATVEHFSTYILLDRKLYQDSFTWEDSWDSAGTHSTIEVVLVVDDSGSMGPAGDNLDPKNLRLEVGRELIAALPTGAKVGVVSFGNDATALTPNMTTDHEAAAGWLTPLHFTAMGSLSNLYSAIDLGLGLFESNDSDALRMMIVLTDGRAHDYEQRNAETLAAAQAAQVQIHTVGLADEDMCIVEYLQPLAEQTGGKFQYVSETQSLWDIFRELSKMIDLSLDTDGDTIPDYYEDHCVSFNGMEVALDKTQADTDGDGLTDNQEVAIDLQYSDDGSQILVKGTLYSSPILTDTDYDGCDDAMDAVPLDNRFYGTLTSDYATGSVEGVMDYRWFFGDNSVYNPDLSKASILLASAIYSGSTLSLWDTPQVNKTKGTTLPMVMEYFGLQEAQTVYLGDFYTDKHLSEVGVGFRDVTVAGQTKTVVNVTVRGTNATIEEWSSNCDIGDIRYDFPDDDWTNPLNHKGFDVAATRIIRVVEEYITQQGLDESQLVYWVTGHSRGASIANIIGANYEKAGKTAFTYTFATPNCTLDPEAHSYRSIFNIINEDDFVPCLPIEVWGYTTYGRATTTLSIRESYEKEWEKFTGIGDYNSDAHGMQDCVADIGRILPEGSDPRVEAFRYTCACHGDGSNDTITIKNGGLTEDSREKAIAKIPSNCDDVCIIVRYQGGFLGGWDFTVCQTPSYLMQLLAAFMGGKIDAYRFAVELDIAKRYEAAKGAIISAGISGIEHPHYTESYYVLALHVTEADFG